MRRQDFYYELPNELIARRPAERRTGSRLMCLDGESGVIEHKEFVNLLDKIAPGDLMVFNNTRVIPARVYGTKESGGKVEILVERIIDKNRILAHVRSSKSPKEGSLILLSDSTPVRVERRHDNLFELDFIENNSVLEKLETVGHVPLPPYIDRDDEDIDRERYQTVYGEKKGAVAAPTAGLHFDKSLLEKLKLKGVEIAFVTLHVGSGTFVPVRVDDIHEHKMHSEIMELDENVCEKVRATQAKGKRVIAVGTTSVRCLETASRAGEIKPYQGETNIFIYPSYKYRVVDALVTNFHLPESTLLMLVSAFAGHKHTMQAYRQAVADQYRFFSYGDAMFITKNPNAE